MSRTLAIRALVRIEDGAYANVVLPALLRESALTPRDRAQVTEWVYGTTRMQRALDHLLRDCIDRPIAKLDPPVRAGLRLGAYQLMHGISPHAAVGETVSATGMVSPRAKGFVNAVLRKLAAAGPPWPLPTGDDVESIAIRASMPDWIVQRLVEDLGATDAAAMLAAVNEPGVVPVRINPLRATATDVEAELLAAGVIVTRGALVDDALLVTGTGDIRSLACVREGRATPQDQASQMVATLVGAASGELVLEVGAAPGGKSSAMAEAMDDHGVVVALDRHAGRTRLVAEGAMRLQLRSIQPVIADGMELPFADDSFDRVLLDAPCSGLGVLRRRPEARWRLEPRIIEQLAELQPRLLEAAARAVRPGGTLVYSVCTLTNAETVAVDEWAAQALPDFEAAAPPPAPWTSIGRGARLLPSAADTDGMYLLRLRRTD